MVPYYRSHEQTHNLLLSSYKFSQLSLTLLWGTVSPGTQLLSASHNYPLLSLKLTCTLTIYLSPHNVSLLTLTSLWGTVKQSRDLSLLSLTSTRVRTTFSVTQRFLISAHINMHATLTSPYHLPPARLRSGRMYYWITHMFSLMTEDGGWKWSTNLWGNIIVVIWLL